MIILIHRIFKVENIALICEILSWGLTPVLNLEHVAEGLQEGVEPLLLGMGATDAVVVGTDVTVDGDNLPQPEVVTVPDSLFLDSTKHAVAQRVVMTHSLALILTDSVCLPQHHHGDLFRSLHLV